MQVLGFPPPIFRPGTIDPPSARPVNIDPPDPGLAGWIDPPTPPNGPTWYLPGPIDPALPLSLHCSLSLHPLPPLPPSLGPGR